MSQLASCSRLRAHRHVLRLDLDTDAIPARVERSYACRARPGKGVENSVTGERKHFD